MANLSTIEDMRLYIKQELGYPVINVELADVQLDNIIEDSIQYYNDENYGEGAYRTYLSFSATNGIDEYVLSGNNIQDVFDFAYNTNNGINTLFSPLAMLNQNDMFLKMFTGGDCQGKALTSYQLAMSQISDFNDAFGTLYRVDWWPQTETLKITPTPREDMIGVLLVYKKSELSALINNRYVKALAVGKAKKLWGFIASKYSMQLPGGGTINGEKIESQGITEIEEAKLDIRATSEPIDFYLA